MLLPVLASFAAAIMPIAAAPLSAPQHQTQCRGAEGFAAAFGGRRTFLLQPDQLQTIKAALPSDPRLKADYKTLIARADAALRHRPGSVVDKTTLPPSGDRHDYMSLAPYWWPNPKTRSGLPYVRRDGHFNPARATDAFDRAAIGRLSDDVRTLSLAYYYSDDARYAAKTATLIRAWFLDPATAMNPNVRFAQSIPGRTDGRAEGVLDTNAFQAVIDGVGLIGPSHALSDAELAALQAWFGRYAAWMRTSAIGKAEQAAKNNHGNWYDAQLAEYALFAGDVATARKVVLAFPRRRIVPEIAPNGALPRELTRTRSLHYSIYALMPAYDVAAIGACLGVDLWHFVGPQGGSLEQATRFVAQYRGRLADWPYPTIDPDEHELDVLIDRAAIAWPKAFDPAPLGYPEALIYAAPDAH